MDPVAGFLDDVEDDGRVVAGEYDIIYFFDDVVDILSGDACDWFYLVLDGGEGVLLVILEHEVDLVVELVALVGLAKDVELVGRGLLDDLKFVHVDAG